MVNVSSGMVGLFVRNLSEIMRPGIGSGVNIDKNNVPESTEVTWFSTDKDTVNF